MSFESELVKIWIDTMDGKNAISEQFIDEIKSLISKYALKEENVKDLCHCDVSAGILDHIDNLIKCEGCGKQLGFRTWNAYRTELLKKMGIKEE